MKNVLKSLSIYMENISILLMLTEKSPEHFLTAVYHGREEFNSHDLYASHEIQVECWGRGIAKFLREKLGLTRKKLDFEIGRNKKKMTSTELTAEGNFQLAGSG